VIKTSYVCNACSAEASGLDGRMPDNWRRARWVPGVVTPPGQDNKPKRDEHYCSDACWDQARSEMEDE
jgi:hypothetical protein